MGHYVHISVTFSCNEKQGVMDLAKEILEKNPIDDRDGCREAKWFLNALVAGNGYNCGPKGALWSWGLVGNYTNGEEFVNALMPFWDKLLGKSGEDTAFDFDHVNVFIEPEQSQSAQCFEISREGETEEGRITVKHHEDLPFCWNQM